MMAEDSPGSHSNTTENNNPALAKFAYWGAVVGLVSALATIFVVTYYHGNSMGLTAGECTVLACASTLLLSQPTGIVGLVIGAGAGYWAGILRTRSPFLRISPETFTRLRLASGSMPRP